LETDVLPELHVAASKNTFQQPTLAEPAHKVNLLILILEDVPHSLLVATKMDLDNFHNNNAINANPAQQVNN
jgi:hypothetical protein